MRDFDRADFNDNLSAFEAAVGARRVDVPRIAIKRVLVAVDGSNQDRTTISLAKHLLHVHGALLSWVYASSNEAAIERQRRAEEVAAELGLPAIASLSGSPSDQLLRAAQTSSADLLITCAPYLEDYAELKSHSLGTTLDIVLSRRKQALMVVREPLDDPSSVWTKVIFPLNLMSGASPLAAGWAAKLSRGSSLELLAVADTEVAMDLRAPLGSEERLADLDEDRLAGLVQAEIAGLVAALQRAASDGGYECRVVVRSGPMVQAVTAYANKSSSLVVTTCTSDCASTGFQRVQAIVRESRNPVLVL